MRGIRRSGEGRNEAEGERNREKKGGNRGGDWRGPKGGRGRKEREAGGEGRTPAPMWGSLLG